MPFVLFSAAAAAADYGVGFTRMTVQDPLGGEMLVSLWYPSDARGGSVELGPFTFPATPRAAPAEGRFALVVLSHGSGGSDLGHRDTAIALARAGFIAAAPLHPRNNYRDNSGAGRRIVLDGRPRQFSAVIDALLADKTWSVRIDADKIGAFGFSLGGYTVLAALGAKVQPALIETHCAGRGREDRFCRPRGAARPAERAASAKSPAEAPLDYRDARLCAAVIADPAAVPFSDATLEALPPASILFYRPEVEDVITAEFHVSRVLRILKARGDFPAPQEVVVEKAGHYAFLAPFPEAVAKEVPEIATDAPGFDRAAFHAAMNRRIVGFFGESLTDCPRS